MRKRILVSTVLVNLFIAIVPAFAHHSDVAFDRNSVVQLKTATIITVAWVNPHGIVTCDVKDETGKPVRWTLEMGSPSSMSTVGWNRNSLSAGDVVKIDINPAKNGSHFGRLLRVTTASGKVLSYRSDSGQVESETK